MIKILGHSLLVLSTKVFLSLEHTKLYFQGSLFSHKRWQQKCFTEYYCHGHQFLARLITENNTRQDKADVNAIERDNCISQQ